MELFAGRYVALDALPPASDPEPASFANTDPESREIKKIQDIIEADVCLEANGRVFPVSIILSRRGRVT